LDVGRSNLLNGLLALPSGEISATPMGGTVQPLDFLTVYELVGVIATLLSGVIVFWQSDKSTRNQNTLVATLLGLLFTMIMAVRFEHLPVIKKQTELAQKLSDLDRASRMVDLALDAIRAVDGTREPLMRQVLEKRLDALEESLEELKGGRFTIAAHEMPNFSVDLINRATVSYHATSFVALDDWWNTPWGRQYESLNIEAVKRGVKVKRIFIISSDAELEKVRPYLDRQTTNGIEIRIVRSAQLSTKVTSDLLALDDTLGGELRLTPDKGMKEAEFFTSRRDIDRLKREIRTIELNAEPYVSSPVESSTNGNSAGQVAKQ
jgi:hypothetical protein